MPVTLTTLLAFPALVQAATPLARSGVVTHVVDGDTVWVQIDANDKPLKLRIQGVDAPEICQAGGVQARGALKSWVMGQRVMVVTRSHDDYGRAVGTLHIDGQDLGRRLVANGHAWVYSYQRKKVPYSSEFASAQAARLGVFNDLQAVEPRVFRRQHGSCY